MDNSEKTANIGSTRYKTNKQKTRYGLLVMDCSDYEVTDWSLVLPQDKIIIDILIKRFTSESVKVDLRHV